MEIEKIAGKLDHTIREFVLEIFNREELNILESLGSYKNFLEFRSALCELPALKIESIEPKDDRDKNYREFNVPIRYTANGGEIMKKFDDLLKDEEKIKKLVEYCGWYSDILIHEMQKIYYLWYEK